MENRLKSYKNSSRNVSDIRSRRNDVTVELRKSKKDDQMNKRRNIDVNATSPLKEHNSPASPTNQPLYSSLEEIIVQMQSDDPTLVHRATQAARKMLSQERNPPIDSLIGHGIVPICVRFLESTRWDFYFPLDFGIFQNRFSWIRFNNNSIDIPIALIYNLKPHGHWPILHPVHPIKRSLLPRPVLFRNSSIFWSHHRLT